MDPISLLMAGHSGLMKTKVPHLLDMVMMVVHGCGRVIRRKIWRMLKYLHMIHAWTIHFLLCNFNKIIDSLLDFKIKIFNFPLCYKK